MQYKRNYKILIDKRKLDTLIRLNCPKEILIDLILENKLTLTGDPLIDDNLESLLEIKEFKNWGGNRNPKGTNQYSLGQVDHQVDHQLDHGQDVGQVVDKDKDTDKDIDTHTNKKEVLNSFLSSDTTSLKEKENKKEKEKIYGECVNVHLTDSHYSKLLNEILSKEALNALIDELSLNIARGKAPPYSETQPDCHYACLKVYWRTRKLRQTQPPTQTDKAKVFKEELDKLTEKYRLKEVNSG